MSRYNNKNENVNDKGVTVKEFNVPEYKFDAVHEILTYKKSWYNKSKLTRFMLERLTAINQKTTQVIIALKKWTDRYTGYCLG